DRIGNIKQLTNIVRPDISVALIVGTAHALSFGSVENIAKTKGEIVEALGSGGTAVLNADDINVANMASRVPAEANTLCSLWHLPLQTANSSSMQPMPQPRITKTRVLRCSI